MSAACGSGQGTGDVDDDAVDGDAVIGDGDSADIPVDTPAEGTDVPYDPTRCGEDELRFSLTEDEVTALGEGFLEALRAAGADGAYVDGGVRGTSAHVFVQHVNVVLPVALTEDPRPAVLAWMAAIESSRVAVDEYIPNPDRTGDPDPAGYLAGFVRTTIAGVPFPAAASNIEGFNAHLQANGTDWQINIIDLTPEVFFAKPDDALLQTRCTPSEPPVEDALRAMTYAGLEFDGCVEVGTYTYGPNATDRVEWGGRWDVVVWFAGGDVSASGRRSWVPQLDGALFIDPANYWARIGYADCFCGDDHTGFTLVVHAITGAVLRYGPAIRCVVC